MWGKMGGFAVGDDGLLVVALLSIASLLPIADSFPQQPTGLRRSHVTEHGPGPFSVYLVIAALADVNLQRLLGVEIVFTLFRSE